jgi:hypothetical protein
VTIESLKNIERILFLLKIERAKRPPHGLTATVGGRTTSYCNFHGLATTEGSQTTNSCIAHGLTTTEASQITSTSNGQNLKLKVLVATVAV